MAPQIKPRRRSLRPSRFKIKQESIATLQAELLRRVRAQEGLSRMELARGLNLAPSTVGIHVDHLIQEGFLSEGKTRARDFGRPPTALALNPQGGRFIGVDFEARNIMAVAADFSQRPLKHFHDTIAVGEPVDDILRKIENAIGTVGEESGLPILGIGLGVPGYIDSKRGVALHYRHIKGWENVALVARLAERFKVPVYLENNIRTMALAELWFGQGRGVKHFICLGVRSGIGAGIVIDGQIYRGADGRAGEIGDWPCVQWDRNGKIAGSKTFTVLEEIASFKSVRHLIRKVPGTDPGSLVAPGTELPFSALLAAAQSGDKAVLGVLDRAARSFGLALNQLSCAFNPEKIILAGIFTDFGTMFLKRLEPHLRAFSRGSMPVVVNSNLGDFNGALGAAALAVHEWKPLPVEG